MEQDKVENKCHYRCHAKHVLFFVLVLIALILAYAIIKQTCFGCKSIPSPVAQAISGGVWEALTPMPENMFVM